MDVTELISYISNNGVAIVLMIYFLKNNNKSTIDLTTIITELKNSNEKLNDNITNLLNSCLIKKED